MKSNIDQVIERFKQFSKDANIDFSEALIGATNAAKGKMAFRIFNTGKDSGNLPFGEYTGKKISQKVPFTPYELKRVSKGRQVKKKDLEFLGDLRRGLRVLKRQQNSVVCIIVNPQLVKIAQFQEVQLTKIQKRPVIIWKLTPEERKFYIDNLNALIKQQYARAINSK